MLKFKYFMERDNIFDSFNMDSFGSGEEYQVDTEGNVIEKNVSEDDKGDDEINYDPKDIAELTPEELAEKYHKSKPEKSEEEESEEEEEDDTETNDELETDENEEDTDLEGSLSSPISTLASALLEEGVLRSLSEDDIKEIKSAKDLIDALAKDKEESEYSDLTEEQKTYLKALRLGIPNESLKENFSAQKELESISENDLKDDEELRREIIMQDFLNKGYSEDKAKKLTERSFDIGEDKSDALDALESIKIANKQILDKEMKRREQLELDAQKEREKSLDKLKGKIDKSEEIISGIKLSSKVKEELYKQMTIPAAKNKDGKPLDAVMASWVEDPDYALKVHYLHKITNGFKDFNLLVKKSKSKAIEQLEEQLSKPPKMGKARTVTDGKADEKLLAAVRNLSFNM